MLRSSFEHVGRYRPKPTHSIGADRYKEPRNSTVIFSMVLGSGAVHVLEETED